MYRVWVSGIWGESLTREFLGFKVWTLGGIHPEPKQSNPARFFCLVLRGSLPRRLRLSASGIRSDERPVVAVFSPTGTSQFSRRFGPRPGVQQIASRAKCPKEASVLGNAFQSTRLPTY